MRACPTVSIVLGRPFLRILRDIVRAGERNKTPVTLCGETGRQAAFGHGAARHRLPLGVDVAGSDRSGQGDAAGSRRSRRLSEVMEEALNDTHPTTSMREILVRFAESHNIPLVEQNE